MYEWGPWTNGRERSVNQVPKGKAERRAWLSERVKSRSGKMSDARRASLIKWYGEEKAKTIMFTEAFEIAEYGYQPTDDEILKFFPMLAKTSKP